MHLDMLRSLCGWAAAPFLGSSWLTWKEHCACFSRESSCTASPGKCESRRKYNFWVFMIHMKEPIEILLKYTGCLKCPGTVGYFLRYNIFQKNEGHSWSKFQRGIQWWPSFWPWSWPSWLFEGQLCFFKWKPPFFTSAIDRAENSTFRYVPKS